jgi:hypothetical protein
VSRPGGRRPVIAVAALIILLTAGARLARAQSPTEDMQQYTEEVIRLIRNAAVPAARAPGVARPAASVCAPGV